MAVAQRALDNAPQRNMLHDAPTLGQPSAEVEALLDPSGRSRERPAMGAKPGTGGSSGISWLSKAAEQDVFPEIWAARNVL